MGSRLIRAVIATLFVAGSPPRIASAADDQSGRDSGRVYDPATGGLITVEGERQVSPRLSAYLAELREPIREQWAPMVKAVEGERKVPKCFTGVRPTILLIGLDARGSASAVELMQSSGVEALDEVAVSAVERAQPLPPPPSDFLDERGLLRFSFGFNARGRVKWRDPKKSRTDPDVPIYPDECVTPPAALDARCIVDGIQLPADFKGPTPGSVSVRFVVDRNGVPGEVAILTAGTPAEVEASIRAAVARCRWSPGLNETWAPAAMWVVMPIRFVRPAEPGGSGQPAPSAAPVTPPQN